MGNHFSRTAIYWAFSWFGILATIQRKIADANPNVLEYFTCFHCFFESCTLSDEPKRAFSTLVINYSIERIFFFGIFCTPQAAPPQLIVLALDSPAGRSQLDPYEKIEREAPCVC